jgi:hypothetical protein
MKKTASFGLTLMGLLMFAAAASADPIIVEEADTTWEPALFSTASPDIDPRVIGEYCTVLFTPSLTVSEDLLTRSESVKPRIAVEYASIIGQFGLSAMPACQSDISRDGQVGPADLALLASDFGRNNCTGDCPADLAPDGDVDGDDLAVMASEFWNSGCPLMD